MIRQVWMLACVVASLACPAIADQTPLFKSQMDKVTYGIGVETARNFQLQGIELDLDLLLAGLKDGLSGRVKIPDKELRNIMIGFQTELRQRRSSSKQLAVRDRGSKADASLTETGGNDDPVRLPMPNGVK